MKATEKQSSVRKLFVERMRREGREQEWHTTVKAVMEETGKRFGQAAWEAMRRMGYEGPEKERQLHQEFLKKGQKSKLRQQIDREREEIREEKSEEDFAWAIRMLPDKAPASTEIDWIRTHPAMIRRTRRNSLKDILITPEDILCAPNGVAPSKAAVSALQHWANCPHEFFKQVLGERTKLPEETRSSRYEDEPGSQEIRRLLGQIESRETDLCEVGRC